MGVSYELAEQVIRHRFDGLLPGTSVVTLGRQFFSITDSQLFTILAKYDYVKMDENGSVILDERTAGIWNGLKDAGRFYRRKEKFFITDELFFQMIGFDTLTAIDISDFQSANIVFDMNTTGILDKLDDPVDFVFDAGCTEHFFHIPNALQNIYDALKVGGRVFHFLPMNNYPEHGFYQFSATLFADYYTANNYTLHSQKIVEVLETSNPDQGYFYMDYNFQQVGPDMFGVLKDRNLYNAVIAEKTAESSYDVMPVQKRYHKSHENSVTAGTST